MSESPRAPQVLQLASYWPYQVAVVADRVARRITRIVKAHGLNLSQWRVLAAVADVPGRSSTEVVALTPMDKGVVSRAGRALVDQGLLRREASASDARWRHLYLTPAGEAVYADILPEVRSAVGSLDEGLSDAERAQLAALLATLVDPEANGA